MNHFVIYISDTAGRNCASQVYTVIEKVFIRNLSLRFYAKSKFCVCFEVYIPVGVGEILVRLNVFPMKGNVCPEGQKSF